MEAGVDFLGEGGPADLAVPLQDADRKTGVGKVGRRDQAVVTAADDERVIGVLGAADAHLPSTIPLAADYALSALFLAYPYGRRRWCGCYDRARRSPLPIPADSRRRTKAMASQTTMRVITPAELEAMDPDGERYELIRGELREVLGVG